MTSARLLGMANTSHGGEKSTRDLLDRIEGALGVVLDASDMHAEPPDQDTRALRRWENEGGRCEHTHTESAERQTKTANAR